MVDNGGTGLRLAHDGVGLPKQGKEGIVGIGPVREPSHDSIGSGGLERAGPGPRNGDGKPLAIEALFNVPEDGTVQEVDNTVAEGVPRLGPLGSLTDPGKALGGKPSILVGFGHQGAQERRDTRSFKAESDPRRRSARS